MVAYLQDSVVDDHRLTAKTSEKPKPAGLPLNHEAALKWFYKDPQGEIQGELGRGFLCSKCHLNAVLFSSSSKHSPESTLLCCFLRPIQKPGDDRVVPGWLLHNVSLGQKRK